MKLLKAVQGRLGNGGGALGGALAELGGGNGNDLVCVASKVSTISYRNIILNKVAPLKGLA